MVNEKGEKFTTLAGQIADAKAKLKDLTEQAVAARKALQDANDVLNFMYQSMQNPDPNPLKRVQFTPEGVQAIKDALKAAQVASKAADDAQADQTAVVQNFQMQITAMKNKAATALTEFNQLRDQLFKNSAVAVTQAQEQVDKADATNHEKVVKAVEKITEENTKAAEKALAPWLKLLEEIPTAYKEMSNRLQAEADRVREAVATPEEKLEAERQKLLELSGFLTPEQMDAAMNAITEKQEALAAERAQLIEKYYEDEKEAARKHAIDIANVQGEAEALRAEASRNANALLLAQLDQEQRTERDRWQQYRDQNLIDEKTYQQALTDLAKKAADARARIGTGNPVAGAVDGAAAGLGEWVQQATNAYNASQRLVTDGLNGVSAALLDIVTGAKSAGQAFKEFAAGMLKEIADIIIKAELGLLIKSLLGGFVHGLNGGGQVAGGTQKLNRGGMVRKFAGGGMVPGSGPDRDSVPALLTPGEFVMPRRIVMQSGMLDFLEHIRSVNSASIMRKAMGGVVPPLEGFSPATNRRGGIGDTIVQPAIVAREGEMRTLLSGGRNAMLDFLNSHGFRPARNG